MRTGQLGLARFLIACTLVAALILVLGVRPVQADGVVGNGTPDTCTEAAFEAALLGGGSVSFNCGGAPHTILMTSQKSINANTTIDGGGKITLDGQDAHRLFDVGAALTLRNIVLTRAYFNGDGGAIRNNSNGTLILENSTIRDSRATLSGGAILSTGPLTITNSLLEGNRALNAGALYPRFALARTTIVGSVLRNNHATDLTNNGWGGALLAWDGAVVTIERSEIYSNTARLGGSIYNDPNSVLTLQSNTLVRDNRAADSGGGVSNWGTATLSDVTFSSNSAPYGGGFWNDGTATLTNITFSGNLAPSLPTTGSSAGGGLTNNRTVTLTNVTFGGNWAFGAGGGLVNNHTATLTNVTFSGNSAGRDGGGLANAVGTAELTNVTFSGNSAPQGDSTYRLSGAIILRNTIVANSPSGENCAGGVTDSGFNLASDTSCGLNHVPDVLLGPLADNGGPTKTHLPLPGSPAIDFVADGCPPPATDQRGVARPVGTLCDAGAVEYEPILPSLYLPIVLK